MAECFLLFRQRQGYGKTGAMSALFVWQPVVINGYGAEVFVDKLLNNGQTKSGAVGAGGMERFKNCFRRRLGNTAAVIGNNQGKPQLVCTTFSLYCFFLCPDLDLLFPWRTEGHGVLYQMGKQGKR